jgi:hypothetical protein
MIRLDILVEGGLRSIAKFDFALARFPALIGMLSDIEWKAIDSDTQIHGSTFDQAQQFFGIILKDFVYV